MLFSFPWRWVAAVALAAITSCSRPLQPDGVVPARQGQLSLGAKAIDGAPDVRSSAPSVFPLEVGNRWHYLYDATYTPVSCAPELGPQPPYKVVGLLESELTCTREFSGRQLFIQESKSTLIEAPWVNPGNPIVQTNWTYYRQDASGLYGGRFAGPSVDPCENPSTPVQPARAPHGSQDVRFPELSANAWAMAGAGPFVAPTPSGESQVLGQPLHVGARWGWDESGLYGQEVEAIEVLDLPIGRVPAYRIRSFGLPPNWRITWWYGRAGLLKRVDYRLMYCEFPVCGCDVVLESTLKVTHVALRRPPPR